MKENAIMGINIDSLEDLQKAQETLDKLFERYEKNERSANKIHTILRIEEIDLPIKMVENEIFDWLDEEYDLAFPKEIEEEKNISWYMEEFYEGF